MPNLRGKTWTTSTPANVGDAQYWEDHLISDTAASKAASSVQSVNNTTPDAQGNVDIVALPDGGTVGQILTKQSSVDGDADWEDPASSGHTIEDEDGNTMPYQETLQFENAEVTNDSVNNKTIVDCKGSKGDAATITVGTVTTLPAGSQATVVNSGTSGAAVFDFGIPKGADGSGIGDMTKAEYATNGEAGVVDEAVTLKGLTASIADLNKTSRVVEQIYADNGVLGAKNLLPYPYAETTSTKNGITFTVNSDSTVTVNGTATAEVIFTIHRYLTDIKLSGNFILNGCPTGGTNTTYQIFLQRRNAGNTGWDNPIYRDFGDGVNATIEDGRLFDVNILIRNGATLNNLVFKPMLRLASDPDDTYVPYAMTNRELTEELTLDSFIIGQTGCTLQVVKYGKIVEVRRDSVSSLTADTDTIVGQLSAGYKPKETIASYFATHDNNKCMIQIGSNGNVTIRSSRTNYFLPMCLTFIAEQ